MAIVYNGLPHNRQFLTIMEWSEADIDQALQQGLEIPELCLAAGEGIRFSELGDYDLALAEAKASRLAGKWLEPTKE